MVCRASFCRAQTNEPNTEKKEFEQEETEKTEKEFSDYASLAFHANSNALFAQRVRWLTSHKSQFTPLFSLFPPVQNPPVPIEFTAKCRWRELNPHSLTWTWT